MLEEYKLCENCGKPLYNYHGNIILSNHKQVKKFCDNNCQQEFYYRKYIKEWQDGIVDGLSKSEWGGISKYVRRYIFRKYDNKCCICGWCEVNQYTNRIPLEIDHIDGNSENNKEENLRLICPNCHSLTENFRALNKGNGRSKTWIPKK